MLLCPWDSPGKKTGVGSHSLLHGIFPTQGSIQSLPHSRQTLYHLSHQGSPYKYPELGSAKGFEHQVSFVLFRKDAFYN